MSRVAGYSGTPLAKKLGIKPGSTLALIAAPAGFASRIDGMPERVRVSTRAARGADLVVWFVTSRRELEGRVAALALLQSGGLWIAWPKKTSGVATDVSENIVRDAGLRQGLVDYKVCAIDDTWSGLKFATRRPKS